MRTFIIILILSLASPCLAVEVTTARGNTITIKNGDTIGGGVGIIDFGGIQTTAHKTISFWEGTIEGLEDVTFVQWSFNRNTPHTEVFINCKNLHFIKSSLVNVEIAEDFIVEDSLAMHKEDYEDGGYEYEKIETIYGKTHLRRIEKIQVDIIERDYADLKKADKDKIRADLEEAGVETIQEEIIETELSVTDTPNEKKYTNSFPDIAILNIAIP